METPWVDSAESDIIPLALCRAASPTVHTQILKGCSMLCSASLWNCSCDPVKLWQIILVQPQRLKVLFEMKKRSVAFSRLKGSFLSRPASTQSKNNIIINLMLLWWRPGLPTYYLFIVHVRNCEMEEESMKVRLLEKRRHSACVAQWTKLQKVHSSWAREALHWKWVSPLNWQTTRKCFGVVNRSSGRRKGRSCK